MSSVVRRLILALIFQGMVVNALASANAFFISDQSKAILNRSLGSMDSHSNAEGALYIARLNFSDCINCSRPAYFLNQLADSARAIVLVDDVYLRKSRLIRNQYKIHEPIELVALSAIDSFLNSLSKPLKLPYSWIIRVDRNVGSWIPLNKFEGPESFSISVPSPTRKLRFQDSAVFFSGISDVQSLKDNFVLISIPSDELLLFNDSGELLGIPKPDLIQIRDMFDAYIATFPPEIRAMNSHRRSIDLHNKKLVPMGFKLLTFQNLIKYKSDLYTIAKFQPPIQDSIDNFVIAGMFFLMRLHPQSDSVKFCDILPIETKGDMGCWPVPSNYSRIDRNTLYLGLSNPKWTKDSTRTRFLAREFELINGRYKRTREIEFPQFDDQNCDRSRTNLGAVISDFAGKKEARIYFLFTPCYSPHLESANAKAMTSNDANWCAKYSNLWAGSIKNRNFSIFYLNKSAFIAELDSNLGNIIHTVEINLESENLWHVKWDDKRGRFTLITADKNMNFYLTEFEGKRLLQKLNW